MTTKFDKAHGRDYQKERKRYDGKPSVKKKRAARNRARYAYEKKHGDLPGHIHVDHIRSMDKGGTNKLSNLRAMHVSKNSGFKRDARNNPKR